MLAKLLESFLLQNRFPVALDIIKCIFTFDSLEDGTMVEGHRFHIKFSKIQDIKGPSFFKMLKCVLNYRITHFMREAMDHKTYEDFVEFFVQLKRKINALIFESDVAFIRKFGLKLKGHFIRDV